MPHSPRPIIPPPKNWQDFQVLCWALWKDIWKDAGAQQNGRQGQRQNGVDIFGQPKGAAFVGVQCKGRESFTLDPVTEKDLRAEVEKAKSFSPPLGEFILATTAPRDVAIQEVARQITEQHRKEGLFSVVVWSWDDIADHIWVFCPELVAQFFPDYSHLGTKQIVERLDELRDTQRAILANQQADPEPQDNHRPGVAATQSFRVELPDAQLVSEFQAELDTIRDQIRAFRAKDALKHLSGLRERVWQTPGVNNLVKFRVISNQGAALLHLGQTQDAARRFLEALPFNPDDPKALLNAATAHLLLKNGQEAITFAERVIAKDPLNPLAYSLRIQAEFGTCSFETMLESVPASVRETTEVAHALGEHARRLGNLLLAEEWFRKAIGLDSKPSPDLLASLGEVLLSQVVAKGRKIDFGTADPDAVRLSSEALQFFNEAWGGIADTDMAPQRSNILANRALARSFLGHRDKAVADLTLALTFDPDSAGLKRNLALLLLEHDAVRAEKLVCEIVGTKEAPEAHLILAEIRRKRKDLEGALQAVEDQLKIECDSSLGLDAKRLKIDLQVELRLLDQARSAAQEALADGSRDPIILTLAARIERLAGDPERSSSLLREAASVLAADSGPREVIFVADEFYNQHCWSEAVPLYDRFIDVTVDSPHLRRFANTLVLANRSDRALLICEHFLKGDQGNEFFANLAAVICEEIGDLPRAREFCEAYLGQARGDEKVLLRLAVLNYRAGRTADVDAYLSKRRMTEDLSLLDRLQLAELYGLRDKAIDALDVLYEARRRYSREADAHTGYYSNFFRLEKDQMPELDFVTVRKDAAVQVRDSLGVTKWYILEDRDDSDPLRGEINLATPLSQLLLGKKVGDEIDLPSNSYSRERLTVVDVKSKYVRALHETLESFNTLFVGDSRLARFTDIDPARKESLEPIFESVSRRAEKGDAVSREYNQGRMTIGVVMQLMSCDVIEAIAALASKEHGLICCSGNEPERLQAVKALDTASILVLDPTSLACAFGLSLLPMVLRLKARLVIAQSTRDQFLLGRDQKQLERRGFMTLAKENGVFYRREVTKEEVAQAVQARQDLIDWIDSNCEVLPLKSLLTFDRKRKKILDDAIGEAFIESAMLAAEQKGTLLSEDLTHRLLAAHEFKTQGAWLHTVALTLQKRGACTQDEYSAWTETIISSGIRPITVNADVLIHAARQSGWLPGQPFAGTIRMLKRRNCDPASALLVGGMTIYQLYKQPALREQRSQLIWAILDAVSDHPDGEAQIESLEGLFSSQLKWLPTLLEELLSIISAWKTFRKGLWRPGQDS